MIVVFNVSLVITASGCGYWLEHSQKICCFLQMGWPTFFCSFVSLSVLIVMYVPFCVFCLFVLLCVLFVCKCVLDYCQRDIGALFDYPNCGFSVLFPKYKCQGITRKDGALPALPNIFSFYCYICSVFCTLVTVCV
jgi:hypothetical protein